MVTSEARPWPSSLACTANTREKSKAPAWGRAGPGWSRTRVQARLRTRDKDGGGIEREPREGIMADNLTLVEDPHGASVVVDALVREEELEDHVAKEGEIEAPVDDEP